MSVWSARRKARVQQAAPLDPKDDLTIRVAQRICQIVYSSCDCKQRGLNQVCDGMRNAAQHAMQEIME